MPDFLKHSFCFQNFEMGSAFKNPKVVSWWAFLFLFYSLFQPCFAANIITQGQLIRDGETIISAGQKFVLGFFSPGNSTDRYVGIWYYGISQSVVWVANRENKISGESGVISLEENGDLVVLDGNRNPVWSSNSTTSLKNVTATLSDTGNLMILSNNSNNPLWQSFDNPTDTFLPNMRVHVNVQAGENRVISSWKSENDPSFGRYLMGVDPRVSPQLVIWDGQNRLWRSGHWDGLIFIGMPYMRTLYLYGFKISNEENGSYYITYTTFNATDLMKFRIGWNGFAKQEEWDEGENKWNIMQIEPRSDCDIYNKCGNFGICNVVEEESYICNCIEGFDPKNLSQWEKGNWTDGCVRRTNLQCGTNETGVGEKDGFLKMEGVKLPDLADMAAAKNEEDCKEECSINCSCQAYVFVRGINCMVWNGDLVDMRHFTEGGSELYVRVANSELGGKNKISKVVIIVSAVMGILFLTVSILLLWRFRKKRGSLWKKIEVATVDARRSREFSTDFSGENELGVEGKTGQELSLYSFSDIAAATDNFSEENKLGMGGFGPVYKGNLSGEEIAVKRLSKKSGQGLEEFKNEVMLIAKLQHINLVRLLGCCIEGDERILLYEYMLNKSLDCFLFDPAKQAQLDWKKRFTIVEGIVRGLVYLHRDSRLRIIHRDLKASNILLDEEMNPKISDFGMAIIFGRNESEASTSRVVGTYGYMAPEYAMEGLFSVKSDVYSFGILLLEIVTGRRNVSFRTPEYSNIVGHAWDLWAGGKAMELVDPSIADFCNQNQVLRCIHVAMLCVQDLAEHRPDISSVVLMLESENATLPMPREPTFTSMRNSGNVEISKDSHEVAFSNDVTITVIIGR